MLLQFDSAVDLVSGKNASVRSNHKRHRRRKGEKSEEERGKSEVRSKSGEDQIVTEAKRHLPNKTWMDRIYRRAGFPTRLFVGARHASPTFLHASPGGGTPINRYGHLGITPTAFHKRRSWRKGEKSEEERGKSEVRSKSGEDQIVTEAKRHLPNKTWMDRIYRRAGFPTRLFVGARHASPTFLHASPGGGTPINRYRHLGFAPTAFHKRRRWR